MKPETSENAARRSVNDLFFVLAQLVLFLLFFVLPEVRRLDFLQMLKPVGYIFAGAGLALSVMGTLRLGRQITPFPTPKENSELIKNGIFRYIRHPIYGGIILFLTGFAMIDASLTKLIVSTAVLIFFLIKSSYEEKRLSARFPDYSEYKKYTRRFFL